MIKDLQRLVEGFDQRLHRVFNEQNVVAGGVSEERMRQIVGQAQEELAETIRRNLQAEIQRYALGGGVQQRHNASPANARVTPTNVGFALHMCNGKFHRVPQAWRSQHADCGSCG
mgnify:CR=1 FL=1